MKLMLRRVIRVSEEEEYEEYDVDPECYFLCLEECEGDPLCEEDCIDSCLEEEEDRDEECEDDVICEDDSPF